MSSSPRGVNLLGFFRAEFGQGEVARRLDRALRHAGIPHTTIPYEAVPHRQEYAFEHVVGELHDVNLLCLNAEHLIGFAQTEAAELLHDRISVGIWFWETSVFPDYLRPALKYVDEIWVASDFVAEAIRATTSVPVRTFPLPVEPPAAASISRAELGWPDDRSVFSFVFDFHSTIARKNPLGLIEAYSRAFTPDGRAFLAVKSISGDKFPDDRRRLQEATGGRPDILVIDGFVPADQVSAYTSLADASVSLHRSEGFGLTLAEAMALGKPVIATGYSGNLAFMDGDNSLLVRHRLTELAEDVGPYPAGSVWAEPDLDHAAELMRAVVDRSDEARERAGRGRRTILENHAVEQTAEFLREQVPRLHRRHLERRRLTTPAEQAADYLARGPRTAWSQPSRLGRVGLLYRRLLLRLLRPYTARQQQLEHTLVDGLRELELEAADLRRRLDELERQRGGT